VEAYSPSDSRLRGEELSAEALSEAAKMKSQPDLLPLIHCRQIPVIILPRPASYLVGRTDGREKTLAKM
jgi:hypothetical protein